MTRTVKAGEKTIEYDLQIKKVKNINLRIYPDGKICVSANRWVKKSTVDRFVLSKADLIEKAFKRYEMCKSEQYYTEKELVKLVTELCQKVYPYFEKRGVAYPQIKFRKMVSRWGSCHPTKGVLTFNKNLMFAPLECIEYVVFHEFVHFLQANHSTRFYEELSNVCPDYKERRNKLKEVKIR
ncbi:MAG: DUF45 domain-containing protein [Clostridia bacterium]|nr:DUF45 domain-containing protein [Clostridia bacterium]